jgi:hypothetical protein
MARIEKSSRPRGVPAKVALQESDSTSVVPAKFRTSSDGVRFGNTKQHWDDSAQLEYGVETQMVPTLNIPSSLLAYKGFPDVALSWGDTVTSSFKRGLGDSFTQRQTSFAVQKPPVRDEENPAVRALSLETRAEFFLTGSKLSTTGPGFQNPLWSKTVIEINMPGTSSLELANRFNSGSDFAMAYYDFATQEFVNIGDGIRFDEHHISIRPAEEWFDKKAVAFGPASVDSFAAEKKVAGGVCATFGFPWHEKYCINPTSSATGVLFPVSGIINEPFLLEKIVIEFSASVERTGTAKFTRCSPYLSTFFVMNQKPGFVTSSIEFGTAANPTEWSIASTHASGKLDLITALQFGVNDGSGVTDVFFPELFVDSNLINDGVSTGLVVMSGTIKTPSKIDGFTMFDASDGGVYQTVALSNPVGGRSGILEPQSRNWKGTFPSTNISSSVTESGFSFKYPDSAWVDNPYLLFPQDKLIFGWQCPITPLLSNGGTFSWSSDEAVRLTVLPGARVFLYGSFIRYETEDPEEFHDTLNQLLTTIEITEVVG